MTKFVPEAKVRETSVLIRSFTTAMASQSGEQWQLPAIPLNALRATRALIFNLDATTLDGKDGGVCGQVSGHSSGSRGQVLSNLILCVFISAMADETCYQHFVGYVSGSEFYPEIREDETLDSRLWLDFIDYCGRDIVLAMERANNTEELSQDAYNMNMAYIARELARILLRVIRFHSVSQHIESLPIHLAEIVIEQGHIFDDSTTSLSDVYNNFPYKLADDLAEEHSVYRKFVETWNKQLGTVAGSGGVGVVTILLRQHYGVGEVWGES